MTCIQDGILRAQLDGELAGNELEEVNQHLAACADCRARLENLKVAAKSAEGLLTALGNDSSKDDAEFSPVVAYAQFKSRLDAEDLPQPSWASRLFAPRWRPVWGLAVAVVVVIAAVSWISPVRVLAQRLLMTLRVQKIAVVSIDRGALMGYNENAPYKLVSQFLADNVVVTKKAGEPEKASDAAQAAQLAGFPIRTIGNLGEPQIIKVEGAKAVQFTVDRERLEALLGEIGRSDIHVPESVNGATIAFSMSKTVVSGYGDCPAWSRGAANEREAEHPSANENCAYLMQTPSPVMSVPADLNMPEIAAAALEVAGMSRSEAHSFCQTVDWSSTLVVPFFAGTYEKVTVDGVEGVLSTEGPRGHGYNLVWIKDGMMYSLRARGGASDALSLAGSLQ